MLSIAITGHRPNKLGNEYDLDGPITTKIRQEIIKILKQEKPDKIITGMALGVDQLFALIGIEMNIPIIAAIPCGNYFSQWPLKSQKLYNEILSSKQICQITLVSDEEYKPYLMQKRNEWMVDHCDKLIAVWNGTNGGTKNCIDYAKKVNKPIIYINI